MTNNPTGTNNNEEREEWETMISWNEFCGEARWFVLDDLRRRTEAREHRASHREKAAAIARRVQAERDERGRRFRQFGWHCWCAFIKRVYHSYARLGRRSPSWVMLHLRLSSLPVAQAELPPKTKP